MRGSDWLLLLGCALLLVAGPAMGLQEIAEYQSARSVAELTGTPPDLDVSYRLPWRTAAFALVLWVGVVGTVVALRIARQPRLRKVSGRLVALLLTGMALVDLVFLLDGRLLTAHHVTRAAALTWTYPLAAILMGGSLLRITELEEIFGEGARQGATPAR